MILNLISELEAAVKENATAIREVGGGVPDIVTKIRSCTSKYSCLVDLINAVIPLLADRPELNLTRRQLNIVCEYSGAVREVFASAERNLHRYERATVGNLRQLTDLMSRFTAVLEKFEELRKSDSAELKSKDSQIKSLKNEVKQKQDLINDLLMMCQKEDVVSKPVERSENLKSRPNATETITRPVESPVKSVEKPSVSSEKAYGIRSETSSVRKSVKSSTSKSDKTSSKQFEKKLIRNLFSESDSEPEEPKLVCKPVNVVVKRLKESEIEKRSPEYVAKQQALEKLVEGRLAIAARKVESAKAPAVDTAVMSDKSVPSESSRPSVAKRIRQTLISSKKSKSSSESSEKREHDDSTVAAAKKRKTSSSSASSASHSRSRNSPVADKVKAEETLNEILENAPLKYLGEAYIPLDPIANENCKNSVNVKPDNRQQPEVKPEFKDEVLSIKSHTSTPTDEFNVNIDLCLSTSEAGDDQSRKENVVSPSKLGGKHYIFEKIAYREYLVTMKNEIGETIRFHCPEFRTFGLPLLGPEKTLLLIPKHIILKFKLGVETSAAGVFLTTYVDLSLSTSIVAQSFVDPIHLGNIQKTEETVFPLSWGARPQSHFSRTDGAVTSNQLIDLSVHGRNMDSRFPFFAHVVDDMKYPTMLNNRLIIGKDFFLKYLKSTNGMRNVGHLYLLDPHNKAYKVQFREKRIH
ncbi:hypothetical protein V9T40_011988 [Parthenolecanium corni]|uniref:Uncharacterized protein n=1 Tax=Parthenolecanium corni TaxID=536013 RepID=A0AAN9XYX4_9HEMI